jgi:carboxyl-terminal processing protease
MAWLSVAVNSETVITKEPSGLTGVQGLGHSQRTGWREHMKQRRIAFGITVVFVAFFSGGWLLQRPATQGTGNENKERLFNEIIAYVSQYYVDTLDTGDLYELAIEGMLERLDPYTSYLRREGYEELSLSTTGNYGGVGCRIESRDGWITVVGPLPDTPGDRAGIVAGDLIIEIEGQSTKDWPSQQAADVMRGPPGTEVKLKIARAGIPKPLDFVITRARIHVNYVEGKTSVAPGIGYLRLTSVSATAAQELSEAIEDLRSQGARSLILDLRNNPGGIVQQGVALADLFLDRGKVVVDMKGRAPGESHILATSRPESWPDLPLVVLINRGTASSAEILAGALQDHDRALLLGTRSFGKGVAYRVFPLSETEAVTVTTSRWYTPSGRSIDRPLFRFAPGGAVAGAGAAADSAAPDSVVFLSDAGRRLEGGGGIQPDIEYPDTLTAPEQVFSRTLGGDIPKYTDALARYALDIKGEGTITDEAFTVSPAMLEQLLERVRARGVEMPDSIWAGASDLISTQFGFELARYVFGRPAELIRRTRADIQVAAAIELLTGASTQEELLAAARNQ